MLKHNCYKEDKAPMIKTGQTLRFERHRPISEGEQATDWKLHCDEYSLTCVSLIDCT